jgi:hypothetical protein
MGVNAHGKATDGHAGEDLATRKAAILSQLDIAAEYEAMGVVFTKAAPGAHGWRECRAIGREDRRPSAAVNIQTGHYKDHGAGGEFLSFWDFAVKYGRLGDFKAVLDHYEQKAGCSAPPARPSKPQAAPRNRRGAGSYKVAVASAARQLGGSVEGEWVYHNAEGEEWFRLVRFRVIGKEGTPGKTYRPFHIDPMKGWVQGDPPGPLPLYRLPELLASSGPVWFTEGEKCADLLEGLGLIATTSAHGAHAAEKTDLMPLAGRIVHFTPDHGPAGETYRAAVLAILARLNPRPTVKVVRLPGLAEDGDDVEQWLEALPDRDDVDAAAELRRLAADSQVVDLDTLRVGPGTGAGPSTNGDCHLVFESLSDEDLGIIPLNSIKDSPIRWLWNYRLPRGALAMMAGDGGIGKSMLLLWIASTVTTGKQWPDGSEGPPIGDVIIVSAEDQPDDTIKPRLRALGADVSRVTMVKAKYIVRKPGKPPEVHPASFQDKAYWAEVFRRRPTCSLFIVDPLPSYLGRGINDSKNVEIRAVLEPFLEEIIAPRGICMLGNTHLNKSVDAKTPLHRISGSIAYGNLPRNVHFVVRDPDDASRRFFKQAKCNNAPDDLPAFAFRVERRELTSDDGEIIETVIPVFESTTVALDLREAMGLSNGSGRRGPEPSTTVEIAEWLFDQLLAESPSPTLLARIIEVAGEKGFLGRLVDGKWNQRNALYRAKDAVPKLKAPRAGKRVEELDIPIKAHGKAKRHWSLVNADAVF